MAKVKVFCRRFTDRVADRQDKNLMPPNSKHILYLIQKVKNWETSQNKINCPDFAKNPKIGMIPHKMALFANIKYKDV